MVATPIGNLRDVTLRALDVLHGADVIACEDTRVTAKLLARYELSKRLVALNQHNEQAGARRIVALLGQRRTVAYVSDAGTPGVSDPGARLVAAVRAAGHAVVAVPGPNAALAAYSVAGLDCPRLLIYGFLPAQAAARRRELEALRPLPYALALHEAPHRIVACARDLADALGAGRSVVLARELTKLFETVHACRLGELAGWLEADANRQRGEFVMIVDRAADAPAGDAAEAQRLLALLLDELPLNQAVKLAAKLSGQPRNRLYGLALAMRGEYADPVHPVEAE